MTKRMYQAMRAVADTFARLNWNKPWDELDTKAMEASRMSCLPHFSTLHRIFKPILFRSLAVRGADSSEEMNSRAAGARANSYTTEGLPPSLVRIILPSEYAREDLATGPVFAQMRSTCLQNAFHNCGDIPTHMHSDCVDTWPVVAARDWFYGSPKRVSLDMDHDGGPMTSFCEARDTVRVKMMGTAPLHLDVLHAFGAPSSDHSALVLQGIVSVIWTVHHLSRRGIPDFQQSCEEDVFERDRCVFEALTFLDYNSPTDTVDILIPELPLQDESTVEDFLASQHSEERPSSRKKKKLSPEMAAAVKARRAALKKKKEEMKRAWRHWKMPILKPGDIVTMLRPIAIEDLSGSSTIQPNVSDQNARLCIVHRFWSENEERRRHAFWIPGDAIIPQSTATLHLDRVCSSPNRTGPEVFRYVSHFSLLEMHRGKRGVEKYKPISSMGTLSNGDKYFIYRFLLFWDGFNLLAGKSGSGDGFYMQCLNLPREARSSSTAVRIISLSPPGVKVSAIFKRIQRDIIVGMTTGFLDYDAEGQQRRMFLDLVGFLGDTPALNAELDVLGHTATAFCHLCRVTRQSASLIGSRYVRTGISGSLHGFARGYYQHCAIRDCEAKSETCRMLDIKPPRAENLLPIHALRQATVEARPEIPRSTDGIPIVPGIIDPYRSCFIAPDHLLTGDARDCIDLAFKMLPSARHRLTCETFILLFLSDCNLPQQNRLFDHNNKHLFSMSMTKTYALCTVAELGFRTGHDHEQSKSSSSAELHPKCSVAFQLAGSVAKLISEFWFLPDLYRDGKEFLAFFSARNGQSRIQYLQKLTETHLQLIQDICSMKDEDVVQLDDPACAARKRARIAKEMSLSLLAIKTIDRPNVHRIRELVESNLPMVSHCSRIGELVLEKAHQSLKRGIQQSNFRNPHIEAMMNVTVNDWQGRLTLVALNAVRGDKDALRGCFRLLAGREALSAIHGKLEPSHAQMVRNAIGPVACVPYQLRSQAITVMSMRKNECDGLKWSLSGQKSQARDGEIIASEHITRAWLSFRFAIRFPSEALSIQVADEISATTAEGLSAPSFRRGDVVETACLLPLHFSFHYPFVVQNRTIENDTNIQIESGQSLWCLSSFFEVQKSDSLTEYFAAVLPCKEQTSAAPKNSLCSRTYAVLIHDQGGLRPFSFLKIRPSLR